MAGGVYHVWARGVQKRDIFRDDDDRRSYLSFFGLAAQQFRWRPLAYCLMDNHVHHLIELTKPNLGRGVKEAHGSYARWFNERHSIGGGHLFEKRFGSTRATDAGTLMYLACYVLANPVKAGLSARAADFAWSSCAATLGHVEAARWFDGARLLEHFESREGLEQTIAVVARLGAAGFDPFAVRASRRAADP